MEVELVDRDADEVSRPLGVSFLPGSGKGVDLAAAGYVEHEYLLRGTATEWTYGPGHRLDAASTDVPYTTRVLVRYPADNSAFNGVLQVEPLHPEYDTAPTWRALHPWIMRTGAAWMGITQDPRLADSMRTEFDPERYGELSIPAGSMRYDIVADAVAAARLDGAGIVGNGRPVRRAYLSGWSMTGSFVRVFLGEGFHERRRLLGGAPLFDGYVIGISSGGAQQAGYPGMLDGSPIPMDDPRRRISGHGVPVIELLSETESETHGPVLRPDSDDPGDRYRLYQVAGTSHDATGPRLALTNIEQYRRLGLPASTTQIVETPSDARMDLVARAVFALLDRWVDEEVVPPRADRFTFTGDVLPDHPDVRPLLRDEFGNVHGGIRTPWVRAPLSRYTPHSTPVPEGCRPSPWSPVADPAVMAWMRGHLDPLPGDVLAARYGSAEHYLATFAECCAEQIAEGFLCREDREVLITSAERAALAVLPA